MTLAHFFHLDSLSPQFIYPFGSRTDVTQENFPALKGMSISLLRLKANGFREPHWHPNAYELGYCLEGHALMKIFNPGSNHETFLVEPGTLTFVPKGSLHAIQNLSDQPVKMLICFDQALPEDLNLSQAVGVMPKHVLASVFNQVPNFFEKLALSDQPVFIGEQGEKEDPALSWQTNRYKMNIEATHPQVESQGGWVKMSNQFLMPVLENLALYTLYLAPKGIREPHWHPNAHELNYVISGHVRLTLLSPGKKSETFELQTGDISFLPQGYFHHIENLEEEPAHMAVFFNDPNPSDIGLSGSLGSYSSELLADLFKAPRAYFDSLPKYQEDLFVVAGGG